MHAACCEIGDEIAIDEIGWRLTTVAVTVALTDLIGIHAGRHISCSAQ